MRELVCLYAYNDSKVRFPRPCAAGSSALLRAYCIIPCMPQIPRLSPARTPQTAASVRTFDGC